MFKLFHPSKELLSIFILWRRPVFWDQNMTLYLVWSAFPSSPNSLLPTTKASAFVVIVCTLTPIILTSSEKKLDSDVYPLISSHPGLLETS